MFLVLIRINPSNEGRVCRGLRGRLHDPLLSSKNLVTPSDYARRGQCRRLIFLMMSFLYCAIVGILLFVLIAKAVELGVQTALTSSEVNESLCNAVSHAVTQSLDLHKREQEFAEQND